MDYDDVLNARIREQQAQSLRQAGEAAARSQRAAQAQAAAVRVLQEIGGAVASRLAQLNLPTITNDSTGEVVWPIGGLTESRPYSGITHFKRSPTPYVVIGWRCTTDGLLTQGQHWLNRIASSQDHSGSGWFIDSQGALHDYTEGYEPGSRGSYSPWQDGALQQVAHFVQHPPDTAAELLVPLRWTGAPRRRRWRRTPRPN